MSDTKIHAREGDTSLAVSDHSPNSLIALAISSGADIDKLERLMAMQERWQAQKAKEAYFVALSDFQSICPEIGKVKQVSFTSTRTNTKTEYKYASLGEIDKQIKEAMKSTGLSKQWKIKDEGGKIIVTCIITHKDGHSESTTMEAGADDSGGKNSIQQKGSTVTYLQRYTLLGALGITTADSDDDGRSVGIDLPALTGDQFRSAMKAVASGARTVEGMKVKVTLTADQEKSLQIAQDSRTKKA